MADIKTAEFLVDESLLKLTVKRLMFICSFLDIVTVVTTDSQKEQSLKR